MDVLLDNTGDLHISKKGDIELTNFVAQKIKIRLKWFEGEWRWRKEEGIPYFEHVLVKNPDTDYIESLIRAKIFEVEEVTEVKNVAVTFDRESRTATIRFTAITDLETIKEEVIISCQSME